MQGKHCRARVLLAGGLLLLSIACARSGEEAGEGPGLPLASGAAPEYVGRQACIDCHKDQYDLFVGSDHDMAMDVATEETVLGDFADATFTQHGITSRFFQRDGRFFVNTEGPGGSPTVVLHEPLACSPCGRAPSCAGRFDCMVALTPDRVVRALGAVAGPARDA